MDCSVYLVTVRQALGDCLIMFVGLLARSLHVSGRSCDRPPRYRVSWFSCIFKQMSRWSPRLQVATACFSCSPPDLSLSKSIPMLLSRRQLSLQIMRFSIKETLKFRVCYVTILTSLSHILNSVLLLQEGQKGEA
jgi:hypothetical protein